MRMQLATKVAGDYCEVFRGFDETLLLKLTPPGMKMHLVRTDPPSQLGGSIEIKVTVLGLIRQHWENVFSDHELRADECHFVDTGRRLPFPFKAWRHDHRVLRDGADACIVDDVTYSTGLLLTDWLLYPVVWLQFAYRRPIYRKHFGVRKK